MKFAPSDIAPNVAQRLQMRWTNIFMTMKAISSVIAIAPWNTVEYIDWRFENECNKQCKSLWIRRFY